MKGLGQNSPMPQSTQLEIQSNICFKKFQKTYPEYWNYVRFFDVLSIYTDAHFVSNLTNTKIIFWLKNVKCGIGPSSILTLSYQTYADRFKHYYTNGSKQKYDFMNCTDDQDSGGPLFAQRRMISWY